MLNRYSFNSKATGKPAKIGTFKTRAEARHAKRIAAYRGRYVVIYDRQLGRVIR